MIFREFSKCLEHLFRNNSARPPLILILISHFHFFHSFFKPLHDLWLLISSLKKLKEVQVSYTGAKLIFSRVLPPYCCVLMQIKTGLYSRQKSEFFSNNNSTYWLLACTRETIPKKHLVLQKQPIITSCLKDSWERFAEN